MRKNLARLLALLACVGVAGCAYDNPAQPTRSISVDPSVPAQVTIGAAPGLGTQAGTATVTANVQNGNGAALSNVVVTFATTRGSISPAQVATGVNGVALATLTSSDTADVTASVGTLSAHTLVVTGTASSSPTPSLPVSFLNVTGSATTGVPVVFSVSSSVVGATWTWSFGDGAIEQSTAFSIPHTYGRSGVYIATVSSSAASSSSATVVVTDPVAPPGTTVTGLGLTLTCTPATHGTPTPCNVTVTFAGATVPSVNVTEVDWDWGDGAQNPTTSPIATHAYPSAGTYVVIANVNAKTTSGLQVAQTSRSLVIP